MTDYATGYVAALEDVDDLVTEHLTANPKAAVDDVQGLLHELIDHVKRFLEFSPDASSAANPPTPATRSEAPTNPDASPTEDPGHRHELEPTPTSPGRRQPESQTSSRPSNRQ